MLFYFLLEEVFLSSSTPMYPNTYFLTQEQKDFYTENGYLIIKKLFDVSLLEELRQRFRDYCEGKGKGKVIVLKEYTLIDKNLHPEEYVNKIQELQHDEVFMKYSEDPRLLHVVSQLIGRGLSVPSSMLINKPPQCPRHPPHQDMYYFPMRPLDFIATWTAIDPATIDNGCLYCIPGSHKSELFKHGRDTKKFYHTILEEMKHAPLEKRVHFEMEPGDTIFMHPLLVHGSGANYTKKHRKAMTVHYMNNHCDYIEIEGTVQEPLIKDFKDLVQKNGHPKSFQDFWREKVKVVQKSTSHL